MVNLHDEDTVVLVTEKVMRFQSVLSPLLLIIDCTCTAWLWSFEQDYDRDPEALRTLAVKVWVLSSSLQIMPHKEHGEDEFMRKVKEIIAATGHKKLHVVDK